MNEAILLFGFYGSFLHDGGSAANESRVGGELLRH